MQIECERRGVLEGGVDKTGGNEVATTFLHLLISTQLLLFYSLRFSFFKTG